MNLFLEIIVLTWRVIKSIVIAIAQTVVSPAPKSVEGEVVLITGSGSGLGQLMTIDFAKRGAIVVGWDINQEGNAQTKRKVEEVGAKMHTYICDISCLSAVQKVAAQVKQEVGDVTMLINNAGIVSGKEFLKLSEQNVAKTMEINLLAHFWTTQTFLPAMLERDHGHIVNIASMAGMMNGGCKMTDYCASKFGNVGMTESLAVELRAAGKKNVHTTLVCPYTVNTGMFDGVQVRFSQLFPVLQPADTARTIVKGVLRNQPLVCIPKSMYLMILTKAILPTETSLILHDFFGIPQLMDTFVGRKKDD